MTAMLASVTSLREARIALAAGADIIDLKNPSAGALGALHLPLVREIVANIGRNVAISATVGDLALDDPEIICQRIAGMADTGVDYIKLGLFAGKRQTACIEALAPLCAAGRKIVIVMFADRQPDFALLPLIAANGCVGVMLDTADKSSAGLCGCFSQAELAGFVGQAHDCRLFAGLAGSLRSADIAKLLPLCADYLGFRGALCLGSARTAELDAEAVSEVRRLIPRRLEQAVSF